MLSVQKLYSLLLRFYGSQGWWPLMDEKQGKSLYLGKDLLAEDERLETALGAILTQNVSWTNVDKALYALKQNKMIHAEKLHNAPHDDIAALIRSTGYYNQKTKKIKNFLDWLKGFDYSLSNIRSLGLDDARAQLLAINGIGPETADSILLYALNYKSFVIDAYTKRVLSRLGLASNEESYDALRQFFHEQFEGSVKDYKEFHALFVEHGKRFCLKKPDCAACFLSSQCEKNLLD